MLHVGRKSCIHTKNNFHIKVVAIWDYRSLMKYLHIPYYFYTEDRMKKLLLFKGLFAHFVARYNLSNAKRWENWFSTCRGPLQFSRVPEFHSIITNTIYNFFSIFKQSQKKKILPLFRRERPPSLTGKWKKKFFFSSARPVPPYPARPGNCRICGPLPSNSTASFAQVVRRRRPSQLPTAHHQAD